MAEIRVERKRKASIWPWILGLVVAALLVWGLTQARDNDRDGQETQDTAQISSLLEAPAFEVLLDQAA